MSREKVDNQRIAQRIKKIREEYLNQTQEDFAQALGYSRSYISNLETGDTPVTERFLKLIETIFDANREWLIRGKGEVFKQKLRPEKTEFHLHKEVIPSSQTLVDVGRIHGQEKISYNKGDIVVVPVYNEADAGNALINHFSYEPIEWIPINSKCLRSNIFFVKVTGDSMEPTIPNNSVVFIDVDQKEIKDGKIYLVVIPHIGATVKRLYIEYKNLILKPDNNLYKEKIFPLDTLEKEEIRIVGRVFRVRIIKDL
ncbi:MAG TPA: LexA family transcriptional regulator [Thermodesulfobacteriota bacterium]|nr:LexA family transcriptional regulator [Thermodesulfobacteriota bacterium]